ncbi:hypothetical protein IQ254_03420 [Nodosilinea sp. LEGE 07088]|uniref:hypothetical protein n=1 Tax=Nodosilinea sp. LEGE 07088 TaxID=2777968 RepID=UPI001880DA43|nr:hypothetical protein [Nodosilinea sp. LEGE 07088]MBE9136260.1 hypothetical protein [Nodosilinea sp. LEGE 07088]
MSSHLRPDIGFVPTPADARVAMLKLADLSPTDVAYDLGCGDLNPVLLTPDSVGANAIRPDRWASTGSGVYGLDLVPDQAVPIATWQGG